MDVGDVVLGIAGRARVGYRRSLRDVIAALDEERAEMGK